MRRPTNVGDPSFAESDRDIDLSSIHDRIAGQNRGTKSQKELTHRVSSANKELLVNQTKIVFESIVHQRTAAMEVERYM